jgi:tripeptide aminopeptidase
VLDYKGGDIVLRGDQSVVIRFSENPELANNVGKKIVTTDGTTLLGADNKAGIAIIMTAAQSLLAGAGALHGPIRIGFTPDEEVGGGTTYFDRAKFGAQFAYTVDGERLGELNKETFSADLAPETTEGYEPYIHPHVLEGAEAKTSLKILLRDFNTPGLDVLKHRLEKIVVEVQALHPDTRIELKITEQYRNMKDFMGSDTRVVDFLFEAARRVGLDPKWEPIRGGTDGSRLTEKGLPTPNIFTGGQNFHGPTEWLSVYAMGKSVETVVNLARLWAEKS